MAQGSTPRYEIVLMPQQRGIASYLVAQAGTSSFAFLMRTLVRSFGGAGIELWVYFGYTSTRRYSPGMTTKREKAFRLFDSGLTYRDAEVRKIVPNAGTRRNYYWRWNMTNPNRGPTSPVTRLIGLLGSHFVRARDRQSGYPQGVSAFEAYRQQLLHADTIASLRHEGKPL